MLYPPSRIRVRTRCARIATLVLVTLAAAAVFPAVFFVSPPATAQTAVSSFSVATNGRRQPITGFGTTVFSADDGIDSDRDFYDYDAFARSFADDLGANILRIELSHQAVAIPITPGDRFNLDYTTPIVFDTFDASGPDAITNNIRYFDFQSYRTRVGVRAAQAVAPRVGDDFQLIGTVWTPPHWLKGNRVDQITGEVLPDTQIINDRLFDNRPGLTAAGDTFGGSLPRARPQIIDPVPGQPVPGQPANDGPDPLVQFGEYVAAYVRGLETVEGVQLDYLSIQNEPSLFQEFISSHLSNPDHYVEVLQEVNRAFDNYGIDTRLVGAESIGIGSRFERATDVNGTVVVEQDVQTPERDDAALNVQAEIIEAIWAAELAATPEGEPINPLIDGYATHGVDGRNRGPLRGGDQRVDPTNAWERYLEGYSGGNPDDLDDFNRNTFAGLNSDPLGRADTLNFQTETSGDPHRFTGDTDVSEDPFPPNFGSALSQAVGLHHALADGNVNAYLYWQLSRSTNSAEQEREALLLVGADQDYTPGVEDKKFAAARHFSRFISPGMVRHGLDLTLGDEAGRGDTAADYFRGDLLGSLYVDETTLDFSLVLINTFDEEQAISLNLNGLTSEYDIDLDELVLAGVATDNVITFERLADVVVSDGVVTLTLAPESLVSLTTDVDVIPEPAAGAMFACSVILLRRRRRNAA